MNKRSAAANGLPRILYFNGHHPRRVAVDPTSAREGCYEPMRWASAPSFKAIDATAAIQ